MKVIDLFCGAGGFSEGFERAGFEIIRAYDIWTPAILTHNKNHGDGSVHALKGDVYEISMLDDEAFEKAVPDSEVIIGSPPCIAFSNSNKAGKADKGEGVKLIEAFLRIIARKKYKKGSVLKYWVMENVENSQHYVSNCYDAESLNWEDLNGFKLKIVKKEILNMADFGVPTSRKRFICGDYPDLHTSNNEVIKVKDVLSALGRPNPKNYNKSKLSIVDPVYGIKIKDSQITDHHYIKEIAEFEWTKAKRQKLDKGYMGKMSFPENKEKPARTIMATLSASSRESMIYELEGFDNRYRFPTIREVATLMSFPIDYKFYGDSDSVKYRMIGNAVAPKFSYEIAKAIREDMKKPDSLDRFVHKKNHPDADFVDLNGTIYELKVENIKSKFARFNYHIPYLILNSFRVGLCNEFIDGKVIWNTVIHRSQGKNAKTYEFDLSKLEMVLTQEEIKVANHAATEVLKSVSSNEDLQENYRLPNNKRDGKLGPEEILSFVKENINQIDNRMVKATEIERLFPSQILLGYFILSKILRGFSNE
ncbi:DNA cytosine methyltransferase [Chryseomicrobium palamuruense]